MGHTGGGGCQVKFGEKLFVLQDALMKYIITSLIRTWYFLDSWNFAFLQCGANEVVKFVFLRISVA